MSVAVQELTGFQGKRVVLHVIAEDGSVTEVEGKIEAASEAGVAFKEKGKSGLELYIPEQIESIQPAPDRPKAVARKKMKPVARGAVRQHLLDRHGVQLSWAKAANEDDAFAYHESLDHTDLGHHHVEPEEQTSEREQALSDDEGDTEE